MPERVLVKNSNSGGARTVYHTDATCHVAEELTRPQERPLDAVSGHLDECQFCAGEVDRGGPMRVSLRRRLAGDD